MHSLLLALILMSSIIGRNLLPNEDVPIRVSEANVSIAFGREIEIRAAALTGDPLTKGQIYLQTAGGQPFIIEAETTSDGQIAGVFDVSQNLLMPFQRVYYWFHLRTPSVSEYISPAFYFDYADERYNWQHLKDAAFHVHWYQGDLQFGQQVLTTAHRSLESIQQLLPLELKAPVDITIYASRADFQSSSQTSGPLLYQESSGWVSGAGIIIIPSQGPQQQADLEQEMPNQLMKALLQQFSGMNYAFLPSWLVEGLASLAELQGNPEHQVLLENAWQRKELRNIDALCTSFPSEPASLALARAESESFTRFLYNSYGSGVLLRLLQAYQSGFSCSDAVQKVYSLSLDQIDSNWREAALGIQPGYEAARQLFPYFLLFGLMIVISLLTTAGFLGWKIQNDSGNPK